MFVMFFTIIAFSDSLLTISKGNEPHNQFVTDLPDSLIYTYRIVLGDFDVSQFGSVAVQLVYGLFILCTLFNSIVMLNLLIAIISETFAKVKQNAVNASYQEMSAMISENSYLIPDSIKETYAMQNRNIVVISPDDVVSDNPDNDLEVEKIRVLKVNTAAKLEAISQNLKELTNYISVKKKQDLEIQEVRYV